MTTWRPCVLAQMKDQSGTGYIAVRVWQISGYSRTLYPSGKRASICTCSSATNSLIKCYCIRGRKNRRIVAESISGGVCLGKSNHHAFTCLHFGSILLNVERWSIAARSTLLTCVSLVRITGPCDTPVSQCLTAGVASAAYQASIQAAVSPAGDIQIVAFG